MNVPKGRFSSIHVKHAVISAGLDVCWSSLGPQRRKERKKETFTSVSTRYMASWPHISYIIHGCIITPQPYTHILTPAYTAALHRLTQQPYTGLHSSLTQPYTAALHSLTQQPYTALHNATQTAQTLATATTAADRFPGAPLRPQ